MNSSSVDFYGKNRPELSNSIIQGEILDGIFYSYDIHYLNGKNIQSIIYPERLRLLTELKLNPIKAYPIKKHKKCV